MANECSSHAGNDKFRMAAIRHKNKGWYHTGLRFYNSGTVGTQWSVNGAND